MRSSIRLVVILLLLGCGCSKDEKLAAEPSPSTGDAAVDPSKLGCPTNLAGASLVRIQTDDGVYCMDQREVLWSEYTTFLAANVASTTEQPAFCAWNASFQPEYYEPDDTNHTNEKCPNEYANPLPTQAANCVDFCDAAAYCKSSGKRLCGRVGGPKKWGVVDAPYANPTLQQAEELFDVARSLAMEFQYACTNAGKSSFPYGNAYEAQRCIDSDWVSAKGKSSLGVADTTSSTCRGTEPPFDEIVDLSGSVAEWNNLCLATTCVAAGGGFRQSELELECVGSIGTMSMRAKRPAVGFRCCADAVSSP